jgi:hypothetical protein
MVKYLSFHKSSFALTYIYVNGKAIVWHTPCLIKLTKVSSLITFYLGFVNNQIINICFLLF